MIYELRTYTFQPGKQGEYLKLNAEVGRKVRGDQYGKFEGGWTTEFGVLNQYVHLWSYPDLNERERLRGELAKNETWGRGDGGWQKRRGGPGIGFKSSPRLCAPRKKKSFPRPPPPSPPPIPATSTS